MKTKKSKPKSPKKHVKCNICGQVFAGKKILEHILECRAENPLPRGAAQTQIHTLIVYSPDYPEYVLFLETAGTTKLSALDKFLRDIWLECCGHMSQFDNGETGKGKTVSSVFEDGAIVAYEYDMGSTTYLEIQTFDIRTSNETVPKKPLVIARNEPPAWLCCKCGEPATRVDSSGEGIGPETVYCEACAEKELEDYQRSPIVNSPRAGICGYGCD